MTVGALGELRHFDASEHSERAKNNYLAIAFAFLLLALPYEAVLPGPLRGNGSPARLIGLVMFALIVVAIFANHRFLPRQKATTAGIGFVAIYGALSLFMYARTYHDYYIATDQAALATRFIAGVITCVGLVAYIVQKTWLQSQRTAIVWAFVVGAMVSVVIGLIQGLANKDFRYALVPPGFSRTLEKGLEVRDGFTRVFGTAGHPIEFSLTVAVALPLAIHLARYAKTRNQRVTAAVFTVVLLLAVPASVSRTAVVAVAAAMVVYAVVLPVRALVAGLLVVASAVAAYWVAAPQLFEAVTNLFRNTGSDDSITGRTDDYAVVGDAFRASPWIGYGPGNSIASSRYLDNQWLQAILSGGLVGVTAMIMIVIGVICGVTYSLRQCDPARPEQRDLVFALAGGLTSMIIATTIFDEFGFSQSLLTLFLLYALVWTFHAPAPGDLLKTPISTPTPLRQTLTGVLRMRWRNRGNHARR